MDNEIIIIKCIDGERQLPHFAQKNLKEIANRPTVYTKDCPMLTDNEISEFRRVADFKYDKKTKTNQPVPRKTHSR